MNFKFFKRSFKRSKTTQELGLTPLNYDPSAFPPEIYRGIQIYQDESDRFGSFDEDAFAGENYNLKKQRKPIPPPKTPPSFFAGIFCGALLILLISGSLAFFSLFSKSGGVYRNITVPNLISLDESSAISKLCNEFNCFNYTIEYKHNPLYAEGTVISQSPKPSALRKLYGINGHITLKLTVNKSTEPITLPDIIGLSARDVALELKNSGLNVYISKAYSDSIKEGKIISSSHSLGAQLKKNDTIYITESLGENIRYISIPNLVGLSESAAISLLKSEDLTIGKIIYQKSQLPLGTVTEQSKKDGTSVRIGSKIDLTVSSGSVNTD